LGDLLTALAKKPVPHPWFARFRAEPAAALDDLLRGLARIPPYERATPSEILKRLFGTLPGDDPDLRLLDGTLRAWLERRRHDGTALNREAYGLPRFVTEVMDALSALWLLQLPQCRAWLQDNYLALARWAAPLRLSKTWDLPWAVANAAALTQTDGRLRFHWFRLCAEAARPSQRPMIDPALNGLSNLPSCAGQGASKELIAGLARFGAALVSTPRDQADFLRRWRALKVRFPRSSSTWHGLWCEALADQRYNDKPFRGWLLASDPALARPAARVRASSLPPRQHLLNVLKRIKAGERDKVLPDVIALLAGYERYAEATGDADYFVRSAGNIANEVLAWAPGHALVWAREVLRWAPSNGQAWSLRGRALVRLGREDLAQAVLWEAVRRLPGNAFVRTQLALLLEERGRVSEAEALLREAVANDPKNPGARVELAHLLNRTARKQEAEELLRRSVKDLPDDPIIPYTLAYILISWERLAEATAERDRYVKRSGVDSHSLLLSQLLAEGASGAISAQKHLAERHPGEEDDESLVGADGPVAERAAVTEQLAGQTLRRAATVGHADLLFRLGDAEGARSCLMEVLSEDDDDRYGRVVWALHDPSQRHDLAARYRESFGVLAPHLASATQETPESLWNRLRDEFPERQLLTEFTRLIRGNPDNKTALRLDEWLEVGSESEDGYLRSRLREFLARDGRIDPRSAEQCALLDIAIRREVEVGDLGLEEAA
jgi:Flp pilus assembly protein TadD